MSDSEQNCTERHQMPLLFNMFSVSLTGHAAQNLWLAASVAFM